MGVLHEAVQKLINDIGRAFEFADPVRYIAEAEAAFKALVADEFHKLEARVAQIEALIPPDLLEGGQPETSQPIPPHLEIDANTGQPHPMVIAAMEDAAVSTLTMLDTPEVTALAEASQA